MNFRTEHRPRLIDTTSGIESHDRVRERDPIPSAPNTRHMPFSTTGKSREFSLRQLTLDSAVSPLLRNPTTPFDRTEKKRAHTSALYYSECVLKGITPLVADSAAEGAQGIYNKWWVKSTAAGEAETPLQAQTRSTFHTNSKQSQLPKSDVGHVGKWRKTMHDSHHSRTQENSSVISANVVSVGTTDEQSSRPNSLQDDSSLDRRAEEGDMRHMEPVTIREISTVSSITPAQVRAAKRRLVHELKLSGGSVDTSGFAQCLEFLEAYYRSKNWDGRISSSSYGGTWLTLSKPTYNECKGRNEKGEYLYSLGRMSFDMFKPTNLVCSIQAVFNSVRPVDPKNPDRPLHVPRRLMKEIQRGEVMLQTYE